MLEILNKKRAELEAKLANKSKLQKGFTLTELLIAVFIILILIGIMVVAFTFFGRVDGTELTAKSKSVESAVMQVALGDKNRDIPALTVDGDYTGAKGEAVTRTKDGKVQAMDTVVGFDGKEFFESEKDAKVVLDGVIKNLNENAPGTLDIDGLYGLLRPVDAKRVQKSVAGTVNAADYVVVVRKAQLYNSDVEAYKNYNDELAGMVFSTKTIIDSENVHYNGTNKASKASK